MLPAFLRLQLAPIVLKASKDVLPGGVSTLGDALADWGDTADISRSSLRKGFTRGLELGWRILAAGYAAVATGKDNEFSAVVKAFADSFDDAKSKATGLIDGLRAFLDDPPRIIPNDQKIKDCLRAVIDLNPDEFDDLRATAGGELAGSFAGTDGEDGFALMPRNAALAACVAGTLYQLKLDLPEVGNVLGYDIDDVRDVFQDRLDDALDADDANVDDIRRLRNTTKAIGKILRELEKLLEPFDRIFRNNDLIEKIGTCDPDDIPEVSGAGTMDSETSLPATKATPTGESSGEVHRDPNRINLSRILDDLEPSTAPAAEPISKPAAAVAETSDLELDLDPLGSGSASAEAPAARQEDPFADDSLGELPPEASGATAEQIVNKLHEGFKSGRFADAWEEAKTIDAPEAVFQAALQPIRELALRQGEKATEAGAWEPLFVDLDAGVYELAFRAHTISQPLPKLLPRLLRHVQPETLAILHWLLPTDVLHATLDELLDAGDDDALRIVGTYLKLRGAAEFEWIEAQIIAGKLPDTLWDTAMAALSHGARDEVLPKLQVSVDRADLDEAAKQAVARALLHLADLDTLRAVVAVLPDLKTPEGLAKARQYWRADRAVPFFRKLANWQEIDWLPASWQQELGELLGHVAPALPESDRQKLLNRSDLPESVKKPLADRVARMKAKKLASGVTFADLKSALIEKSEGLEKAWKELGGKDVRVALAIFPTNPVPEVEPALRDFIANVPATADANTWTAVGDALEILVNWDMQSAAELAPHVLRHAPPKQVARACRLLGDLGGPTAVETLKNFLDELGATAEGQMLASREGLAEALVSALVECGKDSQACAALRDYLKAHADRLPTALTLAAARHCVDDGDEAGIEEAVAYLGTVTYTPLVLALAESLARSGHSDVPALFDYLANLFPGADFANARKQMQADPTDINSAAGRKQFARDFARQPSAEKIGQAVALLGPDLDKTSTDRLARGLTRLGTDEALQALVEKLPPATSARVLATLPPNTVLDAMKRVMAGDWKPADAATNFRAWLDTPGISSRTVLESFQAFAGEAWEEKGRARTLRKLGDLVTQVTEADAPETWIDSLLAILRNEGIPEDSRETLVKHILDGPPESALKIIDAVLAKLHAAATADASANSDAPADGEEAGNGTTVTGMPELTGADASLRDKMLDWLATTSTADTELYRVKRLQDGVPAAHVLPLLASLPDSAVAGLPKLAAWLLNDFPEGVADGWSVAIAQSRMLRATPTQAMAEALWTKDTVRRIRTALAALRVGLPTFWGFELDNLEATKYRDAPVYAVAIDDLNMLEPVALFGFAGRERKERARPTSVIVAFGNWPDAAGAATVLPWSRRKEVAEAVGQIWHRSGQAASVETMFAVIRETAPKDAPYSPDHAETHTVGCSNCKARFSVAFPKTEASVKATCGHCGSRLKLKNTSYVGN